MLCNNLEEWDWVGGGRKVVCESCSVMSDSLWTHGHMYAAATAAKSLQSCLTLCDPIDSSPPGSPVPGILQAGTLEWVAISFSNAWKWKVKVKMLSHVRPLATPWTAAYQAPPSMGFSRQEYWIELPLPSPDICIPVANSGWCAAETNIELWSNYSPIKNKFSKNPNKQKSRTRWLHKKDTT